MRSPATSLLVLSLVVAAGCGKSRYDDELSKREPRSQAIEVLKAYRGKDLRELEPDRVRWLLGQMSVLGLKREYQDDVDGYGPWYVWDFRSRDEPPRHLLIEARKKRKVTVDDKVVFTHYHPSYTPISITVLDEGWEVVSETHLTTGWRCYLRAINLQSVVDDYPLVVLETELGSGPGPDIRRQYFAWIGQRFDLVRLEDSDGNATRNRYHIKHFRSGPKVVDLTEPEWEAELLSTNRARVLRALTWLGGIHWDLKFEHGGNTQQWEDPIQVQLWRAVRGRQKVATRIKELLKSDDRWLHEAAKLAADPIEGDF